VDATLTTKGRITIPKAIRNHLCVKPGDRLKFFVHPNGSVVILPTVPASRLRGIVPGLGQPVTIEEMDEAILAGAAEEFLRDA
jgi:AbrB family looped-hinge helix DNA binding protein